MKLDPKTTQGQQTDEAKLKDQGKPEQQDKQDEKEKDPWALTYGRPLSKEGEDMVLNYFKNHPISIRIGRHPQQGLSPKPQEALKKPKGK